MNRIVGLILLAALLAAPCRAEDTREAAPRTEAEREFILGQMRLFLESTRAIAAGLASGDLTTVAAEAAARGRKGTPLSAIPPGMKAKETPAWTAMMGSARAGFDSIADAARAGASPAALVGMLGETMRSCVACHNSYRLVTE
jgi:cytochrome c556